MIHWHMSLPHQVPDLHAYQFEKTKVENFQILLRTTT